MGVRSRVEWLATATAATERRRLRLGFCELDPIETFRTSRAHSASLAASWGSDMLERQSDVGRVEIR
jgi:hypothetical protein